MEKIQKHRRCRRIVILQNIGQIKADPVEIFGIEKVARIVQAPCESSVLTSAPLAQTFAQGVGFAAVRYVLQQVAEMAQLPIHTEQSIHCQLDLLLFFGGNFAVVVCAAKAYQ